MPALEDKPEASVIDEVIYKAPKHTNTLRTTPIVNRLEQLKKFRTRAHANRPCIHADLTAVDTTEAFRV